MANSIQKSNKLVLPTPQVLKQIGVYDKKVVLGKIADLLTGLTQYNRKEWIKTGGNLISAWLSDTLEDEAKFQMKKLIETGKSKKEAYETREGWTNISDIFNYLYSDKAPNAVVFNALKAIQISTTESNPGEKELLKANSFIRIVKSLNPDDIRIMFAAYELYKKYKENKPSKVSNFQDWYIIHHKDMPVNDFCTQADTYLQSMYNTASLQKSKCLFAKILRLSAKLFAYLEDSIIFLDAI